MNHHGTTETQAKLEETEISKETEPRKNSTMKWLLAISFVFVLGLGVFWFVNQSPYATAPFESITDPDLVTIQNFVFKEPLKQFWKEHAFKSRSSYQVEGDTLHAVSQGTSSMLYQEAHVRPSDRPFLTWQWKAVQFPANKKGRDLADKSNNDFTGRVYALFKGRSPVAADVIQYVWDDRYPEGAFSESPFLGNVRILVVQSGPSQDWVSEKRDLMEDYRRLFGRNPRWPLTAVGIMSDSDNTKTRSEIYYRNLSLKKHETHA